MVSKFLLLALFGIAMAHLEGVVVVYLRQTLGITDTESNKVSLDRFPKRYIVIERTEKLRPS